MRTLPAFLPTTVTSTRIRLARNLEAYPFPEKLTKEQAKEIIKAVRYELARMDDFQEHDIAKLSKKQALLMQERHLISPALIQKKDLSAVFLSPDQSIAVMVNEEDHLREQCILKEFDLKKAYERINAIDDAIGERVHFAYDEKLGFLTACPSNLGTGLRASVMMFLPALSWTNEIQKQLPKLQSLGMTVRGVYGEGSKAKGYLYQVSNERTLGVPEMGILSGVEKTVAFLGDLEMHARRKMLEEKERYFRDVCLRAYGTLTNCAVLSNDELTDGLTKVKLGIALGFLHSADVREFNAFLADMRPSSFFVDCCNEGMSEEDCDARRAEIVHALLPNLVDRVD